MRKPIGIAKIAFPEIQKRKRGNIWLENIKKRKEKELDNFFTDKEETPSEKDKELQANSE